MKSQTSTGPARTAAIPLRGPLLRGDRRPRVALVGRVGVGKSTIFEAASSPAASHERLAGVGGAYQECVVDVGLDQVSLVDLPSIASLHHLSEHDRVVLMYLLWGDRWPPIARHESQQPSAAFAAPDVLVHVVDASTLEQDLELSLELSLLGRPMVIALNRIDEAGRKGVFTNVRTLSARLGVPVIATNARMGKGISTLFEAAVGAARRRICPLPQPPGAHIAKSLTSLNEVLASPEIEAAFQVPRPLLVAQLAENNDYFLGEIEMHFPHLLPELAAARAVAAATLPRPLSDELHADRHHRAALLFESVSSPRSQGENAAWRRWLDAFFLDPRWGLLGCLAVFATVLFVVFELGTLLDAMTSARLALWAQQWQPDSMMGVIGRGVADGLIGLTGIVVPYMIPLVVLLVALEKSGIMHRVAFVVDRGFHRIGLHGSVAVPFLIGLGCNVPAIAAAAAAASGRERVAASVLITFVPCSARSAIILALGGKYLGVIGVLSVFAITLGGIALLGRLFARYYADATPGQVQEIPPYRLPVWRDLWRSTWGRTSDIVTIVMPMLVAGSIVLALLGYFGADRIINAAFTPVTSWWLGLPVALGVPILFGVLRKELSLLMIYQALGTQEIVPLLDVTQIFTFLIFLTFYFPCLSTFAVMVRTLGRREAWFSATLSVAVALIVAATVRAVLQAAALLL